MKKRKLFYSCVVECDFRKFIILWLMYLLPLSESLSAQEYGTTILFYNVENLFYPANDTISGDDEFTPDGSRRWTWYRYHQKINSVCRVIVAANGWEPPDVIGICEIEDVHVLQDLVRNPLLRKYPYRIIHRDSPDHRGIDVAFLYRAEKVTEIQTCWFSPLYNGEGMETRELLVSLFTCGKDTLLVSMNHWTSRYGGAYETDDKRVQIAKQLVGWIDSLQSIYPGTPCLIGGDFNDLPESVSLKHLIMNGFVELTDTEFPGTYKYQGRWQSLDHVFLRKDAGMLATEVRILHFPFLLEPDRTNTGSKPRRTYTGFQYNGGISDHLPVLVQFQNLSE